MVLKKIFNRMEMFVLNIVLCQWVMRCPSAVRQSVLLAQNGSFSRKVVLCVRSRLRLSIGVHLSRPYKALSTPCLTGNSSHKSVQNMEIQYKTPNLNEDRGFVVPLTGLEPVRYFYRGILSPLRLPIPPQRHFFNFIKNKYKTLHSSAEFCLGGATRI